MLFARELLLEAVVFFLWLALVLCAYPIATAAHSTAPVNIRQPNPQPLVTTTTLIRLYGPRNVSASTPLCYPNHFR